MHGSFVCLLKIDEVYVVRVLPRRFVDHWLPVERLHGQISVPLCHLAVLFILVPCRSPRGVHEGISEDVLAEERCACLAYSLPVNSLAVPSSLQLFYRSILPCAAAAVAAANGKAKRWPIHFVLKEVESAPLMLRICAFLL